MEQITPNELFIELDKAIIRRYELERETAENEYLIYFIEELITKLN